MAATRAPPETAVEEEPSLVGADTGTGTGIADCDKHVEPAFDEYSDMGGVGTGEGIEVVNPKPNPTVKPVNSNADDKLAELVQLPVS